MKNVTYYACIEFKDGTIMKVPCKNKDDARECIRQMFNPEQHSKCWTE